MYNFISITLNMAIVSVRQRAFLVGMAFLVAAAWFGISLFTVTECSWVKQFLSGMPLDMLCWLYVYKRQRMLHWAGLYVGGHSNRPFMLSHTRKTHL